MSSCCAPASPGQWGTELVKGAASSLAMVLLLRLGCLALECGDLGPMVSEAPVSQKPRVVLAAKQKEILCVPLAWK